MHDKRSWITAGNILVLAALLLFIFGHSLQTRAASTEESTGVLTVLSAFLQRIAGADGLTEHLIRKTAHFCEFAALGFVTVHLCAVRCCVQPHYVLHSLFFGLACAVTDESLQMLSDRSAQVSDILLDFSGVLCGSAIFLLLFWICRVWCRNRKTDQMPQQH